MAAKSDEKQVTTDEKAGDEAVEDKKSIATALTRETIQVFDEIGVKGGLPYVIYSNQTCVYLDKKFKDNSKDDILKECNKIMENYGPVYAGTPAGNFGSLNLKLR